MKRLMKRLMVVLALVSSPLVLSAQSPVSWWQGESNLLDSAGTNNGFLDPFKFSYGTGISGQDFNFNGAFVNVPRSTTLEPANVTVQLWVKGTSPGLYLFNKFGSGSTLSYAM